MADATDKFVADVKRLLVEKAQKMDKRLRPFAAENARRVPCKVCGNIVLPEKMDVHMRAFHE